jgi:hypothetical protein
VTIVAGSSPATISSHGKSCLGAKKQHSKNENRTHLNPSFSGFLAGGYLTGNLVYLATILTWSY